MRRFWIGAGIVFACALAVAVGWWMSRPSLEERLLSVLPERQAIHAYVDLDAVRRSPLLVEWLESTSAGDLGVAGEFLRAAAFSIGDDQIAAAIGGVFTEAALKSFIESRGISCPGSLQDAACSIRATETGGYLSLRLIQPGIAAIVNGRSREGANQLFALGHRRSAVHFTDQVEAALESGAAAWAAIDPALLDAAMQEPPNGWVNLSLIARALQGANAAFLTVRTEGVAVAADLEAHAPNAADARELGKVLEGLNDFSKAMLARYGEEEMEHWAAALDSFRLRLAGPVVHVRWMIEP